jgi:diguanylate cyclase (GGDEF)-like protein/PAS domain S-box-containing protein
MSSKAPTNSDEALRLSERRFRSFVENANDIVFELGLDGVFIYVSPNWTVLLGHEVDEVQGHSFVAFVHHEDAPLCEAFLALVVSSGENQSGVEYRVRHKDGNWRWHMSNGSPLRGADGEINSFLGIARDVTGHQLAKVALQESEERFRRLVQSLPIGIMVHQQGTLVYANPSAAEIMGANTADESMGRSVLELVHPDFLQIVMDRVKAHMESGIVSPPHEAKLIKLDGTVIDVQLQGTPIQYPGMDAVQVTVLDITGRKKLEKKLDQLSRTDPLTGLSNRRDFQEHAERELARSRRFQTPLSVLMLDIDNFKQVNDLFGHAGGDGVLKVLSQSCRTALRKNDIASRWGGEEFAILMPETTAEAAFEVAERWRRELSEAAVLLADGQTIKFTVSIGVSTLVDADANVDDLLKRADLALYEAKNMGRNQVRQASPIRKHLQELVESRTTDLALAKAAAETANVAKSNFLAAASHDLLQPLAALGLYMEVLKNKMSPPNEKLLTNMTNCVAALSELLPDLLDISKLEAGVVTAESSDFPVSDLLSRLVVVHTPQARNKGLRLRCRPSGLHAHTDPVLLKRILGNLIANAIRYTERGGVLIACRRHQGKTWIEIWDSGIGIPQDKTQEVFEEYRQLAPNNQSRGAGPVGSGLGLSIVAKMAALLGLEIRVQSRLGKGSMFAVELQLDAGMTEMRRHPMAQIRYTSA